MHGREKQPERLLFVSLVSCFHIGGGHFLVSNACHEEAGTGRCGPRFDQTLTNTSKNPSTMSVWSAKARLKYLKTDPGMCSCPTGLFVKVFVINMYSMAWSSQPIWKTECTCCMPAARQYCLCFYLHHDGDTGSRTSTVSNWGKASTTWLQHGCKQKGWVCKSIWRNDLLKGVWWDTSFLNHRMDQNFLVFFLKHCQCVHLATWRLGVYLSDKTFFIRVIRIGQDFLLKITLWTLFFAVFPLHSSELPLQWDLWLSGISAISALKFLRTLEFFRRARSPSWYLLLGLMPRVCYTIQGYPITTFLVMKAWVWFDVHIVKNFILQVQIRTCVLRTNQNHFSLTLQSGASWIAVEVPRKVLTSCSLPARQLRLQINVRSYSWGELWVIVYLNVGKLHMQPDSYYILD